MRICPNPTIPSTRLTVVSALTRLYPFLSGCGRLSKSRFLAAASGKTDLDVWGRHDNLEILVPLDDLVGRSIFFFGDLDRRVSRIVEHCVLPGDVVLDVGANIGLYTIKMASIVGADGTIHAFEPNPRALNYLKSSLNVNELRNVRIHDVALGASEERAVLRIQKGNAGHATVREYVQSMSCLNNEIPTRIVTLTDYARKFGIESADFIKIDVEGFEFDAFSGGYDYLKSKPPRAVLFEENREFGIEELPKSVLFMQELGFDVYSVADSRFFTLDLIGQSRLNEWSPGDFLAVNRERINEWQSTQILKI